MKKKLLLGLAISLATLNTAQAVSSNLLVNGSFEDNGTNITKFATVQAGDTTINGWTIGGQGVDWHVGVSNPGLGLFTPEFQQAQDGFLLVDLNRDGSTGQTGTLAQTFNTLIGNSYQLAFYLAATNNWGTTRDVQVDIAGQTRTFTQTTSNSTSLDWGLHTLSFTAVSAATTLMFSSPDSTGFWGPLIDNVSVSAVDSVPEPGVLLLSLGAISLMGVRRKSA